MDTGANCRTISRARLSQIAQDKKRSLIRNWSLSLGFDAVGFTSATQPSEPGDRLKEFLKNGWHGDMSWLENNAEKRKAPNALWPEAKSIIVLGLNYGPNRDPMEILSKPNYGAISVYASGKDYHNIIKKKLRVLARKIHEKFEAEVKLFVDTAPVMEKPLAEAAGIGWQGKHTNIVSRQYGSWLFLGEIFTTLDLSPDEPKSDHCGTCERCIKICPTNAITEPYRLDARRCISYLTIEHKGPIPEEFRTAIGNRIFGCDDCLSICPWNRFASHTTTEELLPHVEKIWPHLDDLILLSEEEFREIFSGSPIKRLGRNRFLRNVAIAIGNSKNPSYVEKLKTLLPEKSPLVRGAAIWALTHLLSRESFNSLRAKHITHEQDSYVLSEWG